MRNQKTKELLDRLAAEYETKEFIDQDPIKFPRRFFDAGDYRNTELAAFFCSMLAWGNRGVIMKDCERLIYDIMGGDPYGYLMDGGRLKPDAPVHRTIKGEDINYMLRGFKKVLRKYDYLFDMASNQETPYMFMLRLRSIFEFINGCSNIHFPNPQRSAAKRLHMMLRWLVRKGSPVDMGLWDLPQDKLLIPVDVHVQRMAGELKLMEQRTVNADYVFCLTRRLQEFDYNDPTRYDFALFGYGITHKNDKP